MIPPQLIAEILQEFLREWDGAGVSCAIGQGDRVSLHFAGTISPADPRRSFYIYSITKTFTAAAVLLLFEAEGFSLDRSFSSFFPKTSIPASITIRQLLNHSAGLSDYSSSAEYPQAVREHPDAPWSHDRLMQVGLAKTPLFPPGEGWAYSNPGYALLKELIEQLSGTNFYAYLQSSILDPLELAETRPFLEPDHAGQLLEAKEPSIQGDFRKRYSPGWIAPGCLISTVTDLVRFYRALFSGKLLSRSALEQMKETVDVPFPFPEPLRAAYGLGVMHARNDPFGNAYGHGGGGPGYTSYAMCYPNLFGVPFCLALIINQSLPQTPMGLASRITKAFVQSQAE